MQPKNLISWKVLVLTVALQMVPAYAQAYLDETGEENYIPPIEIYTPPDSTTEVKPKKREKGGPDLKSRNHAVFFERSSQAVRGTSSDQKVTFSATERSGKTVISFVLNGKEFRFVFGSINLKEMDIDSVELIPVSTGQNKKTADDNAILTLFFRELRRDLNQLEPLENAIWLSLGFSINMIPKDEPFEKMDIENDV